MKQPYQKFKNSRTFKLLAGGEQLIICGISRNQQTRNKLHYLLLRPMYFIIVVNVFTNIIIIIIIILLSKTIAYVLIKRNNSFTLKIMKIYKQQV